MSRKATVLGLAAVLLIAVAAASYFGYTSAGPVDAASLVGPAAPRTGSHFKSPRVEVSVETGDRIDWDSGISNHRTARKIARATGWTELTS